MPTEPPQKPRPWEECSSFDDCSVNACPLHPDYLKFTTSPYDPETKCKALRRTREAIAARHPGLLPTQGVLTRELTKDKRSLASKARWDALSEEEKEKYRSILAKGRKSLSSKSQALKESEQKGEA